MVAVLALGACNEIDEADRLLDYTPPAGDRNVLLEEFTGQMCPNCPEGAREAHRLQENNPGMVIVSIHAGGFAAGTPYVTAAGNAYWETADSTISVRSTSEVNPIMDRLLNLSVIPSAVRL